MTQQHDPDHDRDTSPSPHFTMPRPDEPQAAWEEIEEGRFMPRRVRGSCQGRALG